MEFFLPGGSCQTEFLCLLQQSLFSTKIFSAWDWSILRVMLHFWSSFRSWDWHFTFAPVSGVSWDFEAEVPIEVFGHVFLSRNPERMRCSVLTCDCFFEFDHSRSTRNSSAKKFFCEYQQPRVASRLAADPSDINIVAE